MSTLEKRLIAAAKERRARLWSGKDTSSDLDVVGAAELRRRERQKWEELERQEQERRERRRQTIEAMWREAVKASEPVIPSESEEEKDSREQCAATIRKIQRAVCADFGITFEAMMSDRRQRELVMPRHIAMYLSITLTRRSYPYVGRMFADRDHTTVLHAVRRMQARLASDSELAARVDALTQRLAVPS